MIDYDSKNWLTIVLRMRGSVLPRLLPRILLATGIGGVAAWLYESHRTRVPTIAHTLIGVALGLLLVFRTNASYDRWWEGRKLLGTMVNRSRELARQIAAYLPGETNAAERAELCRWINAWYALACQSMRKERDLGALGELLTTEERAALEPVSSRPTVVAEWISARLAARADAKRLSENRLALMDAQLTALTDALGGCERIAKTPIPFAYAQHIKTFVVLFCFTAPFAMADTMHWLTPVVSGLLAFALLGIDEIGVEIEDPFGYDANDLPLDQISTTIANNTRDAVAARAPQGDAESTHEQNAAA